MNTAESRFRWPIASVVKPNDQATPASNASTANNGSTTAVNGITNSSTLLAIAISEASAMSCAVVVSSAYASAGPPVIPAITPGNAARTA